MHSEAGTGAYPKTLNRQIHGLRGFSALAVYVYHIYGMGMVWNFWPKVLHPVEGFFAAGKHGVELFFIISGYLITGSLIRHGNAERFLVDRAIRIYPVFMTIQVLVFALGPAMHYRWLDGIGLHDWLVAFIANGFFLPGIFDLPLAQLNAWSLSFEAAFYLLSALSFAAARWLGHWPVVVVLPIFLAFVLPIDAPAAFFLPGVVIFFLSRSGPLALPRLLRVLSIPALALTLAVLTLAETRAGLIYWALIPGFVFFLAIVEGCCPLSTILRTRFLQYFGTISYSFYLWSPVVTYPMKLVIQRYLHGRLDDLVIIVLFGTIGFAASVLVAHLSYRMLEDWAGRRLHRWAGSRRALAVAA